MSEHGHCRDCGGTDGKHFNDCTYDGADRGKRYSSKTSDTTQWMVLIAAIIFMGLFPPLGVILFTIVLFM